MHSKKIAFQIRSGEKAAIVGEKGLGKNALVKRITGLYKTNYDRFCMMELTCKILSKYVTCGGKYDSKTVKDHITARICVFSGSMPS
ncbi:ATP-binding cassette domain-containing protein [Paenibacillus apiarius]|uniref:ATP-binding cassette domain-containing protein n=1 Tax=Paenibacillus apiarius TaxID=46240 RepID=UPI0019821E66|nr:ATP-binding cassette domain-containing protein [Paenibacillus apiarius]MBN3525190.1 ATP-binding cassette domain-containing protein [Paenibacillus apiarius]